MKNRLLAILAAVVFCASMLNPQDVANAISLIVKPYTFSNNTKAESAKVNSDFDTVYSGTNAAIGALNTAAGTKSTLAARLAVSMNTDGTFRQMSGVTVGGEWVNPALLQVYSSASKFYISGSDQTDIYLQYRRVKAILTGSTVYSEVSSSTYTGGKTIVTLADAVLTNPVDWVEHSVVTPVTTAGSALSPRMATGYTSATGNTASTIVRRNSFGNFSAGTIAATDIVVGTINATDVVVKSPWVDTRAFANLSTAKAYAKSNSEPLNIYTPQTCTSVNLSGVELGYVVPGAFASCTVTGLKEAKPEYFATNTTPGTTDMTAAIKKAWGAGAKRVIFQPEVYMADNLGIVPAGVTLAGAGRDSTIIRKRANGDLMEMAEGTRLEGLTLDGAGASFTGRNITMTGTSGRQTIDNCIIKDSEGYAIEFTASTAGSQSTFLNSKIYRYDGTSSGKYAIKIEDVIQAAAYPHKFIGIETDGNKFIDIGGGNNVLVTASRIGSILFSDNSLGVSITGSRVAGNEATFEMRGANNNITGCDIGPQIIIPAGTQGLAISGNTYNASPGVVDNSGMGGVNKVDMIDVTYVPTWTAATTAPALGNGTIAGYWSRSGAQVQVTITLTIGSTTTFGTGNWRFALPVTPKAMVPNLSRTMGTVFALDSSTGTIGSALMEIVPDRAYAQILMTGAGPTYYDVDSPWAWETGDSITLSATYTL